jgi:aryl-phospho-beta-D-glucosidase BglC (GH1 family)
VPFALWTSATRGVRTVVSAVAAAAVLAGPLVLAAPAQAAPTQDWLHVEGNQIVDEQGEEVWLTGANWFGFNASERVFHGLWTANLETTTKAMADRGINVVRVPVSAQLLLEWSQGQVVAAPNVNTYANPDLVGKNNLQIFDRFLELCEKYGLKVFLDLHSAEADNSGHVYPMWWKGSITTEKVYQAWEWVTARYKTNDTIIGADVKNEPHGSFSETEFAKWNETTDADNFKHFAETAGKRILAINPNLLIFVEGTAVYPKDDVSWTSTNKDDWYNTWWGGQLRGVAKHPIDLGANQDQLVYSPHDYGPLVFEQPWFTGTWDATTLERDVWDPNWLYIHKQEIAPLLIGEWGGFMDGGRNEKWMVALRDLIARYRLHHTFWVLNPNSGDTGGLLGNDWVSWDEAKYALLKPALWQEGDKFVSLDHQVRLGGAASTTGISLTEATGGTGTPDTTAPSVPANLRAGTATTSSVTLTWDASTDTGGSGLAGYDVYRGTTLVGSPTTATLAVSGLSPATTYAFTVRARDGAGNRSSSSTALAVTTASVGTTPEPTPTPTTTPTTGACAVRYTTNDWSNGFTGSVRLTNTGTAPLSSWTLAFAFPSGQTLTQGWSATWAQTGSAVTATSLAWNGPLAPGTSVEIGFNGTFTGTNTRPAAFTVNGATCTAG